MAKAVSYNYYHKPNNYKATQAEWECFYAAQKKLYPHMYRSRGKNYRKPKRKFVITRLSKRGASDDVETE